MQANVFLLLVILVFIFLVLLNSSLDQDLAIGRVRLATAPQSNKYALSVQILVVVTESTLIEDYLIAIDSLTCYSRIHGYKLRIARDTEYKDFCNQSDKYFRRHCVVSELLDDADITLFLDADIGVVNPSKKIEEFLHPDTDIVFYDRYYNTEVAAGSYIVRNTKWSMQFLRGFADYAYKLPNHTNSIHGTDNGALHAYLLESIFPDRHDSYKLCLSIWHSSEQLEDLFTFVDCSRSILGISDQFGKIRILKKGSSWVRDSFLTNSRWSPERDFMIHGWKQSYLRDIDQMSNISDGVFWYSPFQGAFNMSQCTKGNTTWNYEPKLVADKNSIDQKLEKVVKEVEDGKWRRMATIHRFIDL